MSLGERETTMEAPCCFQDHKDQGSSVGLAQLRGATQKTALGSPSAESALSFLSSLYWGVETQASLLPIHLRERRM